MQKVFEIKATIVDSNPSIFRDIRLEGITNLQILHEVLQAAFCWGNVHRHYFQDLEKNYIKNEDKILLSDILNSKNSLTYVYDYGDSWTLEITLVNQSDYGERIRPTCIGGAMQSPPEDSGGMVGYEDSLDLLKNHRNKTRQYPLIAEWYGENYDPAHFDIGLINSRLANIVLSKP